MNREEIMGLLPHRDAMLLLDEVEREGDTAHGVYHVKGDEFFLREHFPTEPIVPGVILCEILAQSACVLLEVQPGMTPMYTGMNKVKFRSPVKPGDKFETSCRITRSKPPFYFAEGVGRVGDRECVSAEFSFAVIDRNRG